MICHTYTYVSYFTTKLFLSTLLQVEASQEALQARVDATAKEVREFARGYASAVEAHCLSLLHQLEELRVQRRYGPSNIINIPLETNEVFNSTSKEYC